MPRYAPIQRFLHWLIALLLIAMLIMGTVIDSYGFEGLKAAFGMPATNLIYKYHKTFGVVILALTLVRLAVRLRLGKPEYAQSLTLFEKMASGAVHRLFYLLLLAMPALGWLATGAGGFPVEFFNWNLPALIDRDEALSKTLYGLHGVVGNLLLLLIALHVAGALNHALFKRDGLLRRML
ncbi:MAG: cytochrome b/b6 domain-containing protein [Paracoccaceae bacterium]